MTCITPAIVVAAETVTAHCHVDDVLFFPAPEVAAESLRLARGRLAWVRSQEWQRPCTEGFQRVVDDITWRVNCWELLAKAWRAAALADEAELMAALQDLRRLIGERHYWQGTMPEATPW